MKKLAVAIALLATTLSTAAQEQRPTVGIGIGIVPLEIAGTVPTVEVYVPVRVAPQVRLEPSLGVFTNNQRRGGVDSSNVTVGIGAFYVMPVSAQTDVYLGGRVKVNFVTVDTGTVNDSENDFALAAAVGGEHYFSTRFSLGAEGQIGHYQNGRLSGALAANDNGTFTTGVAFIRFYFR